MNLFTLRSLTRRDSESFLRSMSFQRSQNRFGAILSIVLLVSMLTSQEILRDFVLCLGADGHVALEPASVTSRTCVMRPVQEPGFDRSLQWSPDNPSLGQHCGPCEDFILSQMSSTYSEPSRFRLGFSNIPQVGMCLPAIFPWPTEYSRSKKSIDRFDQRNPRPSSMSVLHSTILRI